MVEIVGVRLVVALNLGGGALLFIPLVGRRILKRGVVSLVIGRVGFMLPGIRVGRPIKQRKRTILLILPEVIDRLTISVESGDSAALERVWRIARSFIGCAGRSLGATRSGDAWSR